MNVEQKQGFEGRMSQIKACSSPAELAQVIWTQKMVEVSPGLEEKRKLFVEWIRCYVEGLTPQEWYIYRTPRQLAESIWKPWMDADGDGGVFAELREHLVDWIEEYGEVAK